MGWVEEQFERRVRLHGSQQISAEETNFEVLADQLWTELVNGLRQDVEEYQQLGGEAGINRISDTEYRIANTQAGIAAAIRADLPAHTIQYSYQAEQKKTAVPEGGFLSLRRSPIRAADLYSADQRITPEQARRMILELLLFPNPPRIM